MASRREPTLMSGIPELVVLQLLARREMYGYELAQVLQIESLGTLDLGEGVIYPALHGMKARGLLRPRSQRADGRTRVYYTVTRLGRRRLERLITRWRHLSAGVERILGAPSA